MSGKDSRIGDLPLGRAHKGAELQQRMRITFHCEPCLSAVIPYFSNSFIRSPLHRMNYHQKTGKPPSHCTLRLLWSINALFNICIRLLDCDRFSQVPREIDIETFANSKPICDELERNDVQ